MTQTPPIRRGSINSGSWSLLKAAKYVGVIIGTAILISILIFIFYPDPFINTFLKPRITKAFTEAFPAYSIQLGGMHYQVWKNRLSCDSIVLKTSDSSFTCSVASFSVSGFRWLTVLLHSDVTPNTLTSSIIEAQTFVLKFCHSQNELRCGMLHVSVPDSEMVMDSIKYYCLLDDEQFFEKSPLRQTRYRFDIPHATVTGLDCLAMLQDNTYNARSVSMRNVFVDILLNKDKPFDETVSHPLMPNEILSSMKQIVAVDSVTIINGGFNYCERFAVRATPGVISFKNLNVLVRGIANHTVEPDTMFLQAKGLFMNSGTMELFAAIPLTSKDLSLRYSGSLTRMDATELNTFIEPSEHQRIKSGTLQSATFHINVDAGNASGTLRVVYKDLSVAILNKNTGSEKGFFDRIASAFGKAFVIRGSNQPDGEGVVKTGEILYTKKTGDFFVEFLWFALRSGIGNIVGF